MATRRAFLAGLAAMALTGPSLIRADEPPRTRGWQWRGGAARSALETGSAVAPVRSPYTFNAVGVRWIGPIAGLRVRTSPDGRAWTDWTTVTTHEMHGRIPLEGEPFVGDLIVVPPSLFVQAAADGPIDDLRLDLIDSAAGPSTDGGFARAALAASVSVIPRAQWGADESLRYDERGAEIWTPRYFTPQKVVVHHTVTQNAEANTAATVRAVHYYHARTLGWGDVGYHYLVDRHGNAFEGRYGGPGVEGGHAYGHNSGSIGIACLGTYSTVAISSAMRSTLARLIAIRAPSIDPRQSGWFVDGDMPNLMGHRDAMRFRPGQGTSCPGDALYALLPGIRDEVAGQIGDTPTPRAEIVDLRLEGNPYLVGSTLKVVVTVRNAGTATLTSQDPEPAFLYTESESYVTRGLPGRSGAWRVGVDVAGGGAAAGAPFRWGLPDALAPGASTTVTGLIKVGAHGTREVSARLIHEGRGTETPSSARRVAQVVDPSTLQQRGFVPLMALRSSP